MPNPLKIPGKNPKLKFTLSKNPGYYGYRGF